MLSAGRVIKRGAWRFKARRRDLLTRVYPPSGLAWRQCACCFRVHATVGSTCERLRSELETILRGDLTMANLMALCFGPRGTMSEAGLRVRHAAIADQLAAAESLRVPFPRAWPATVQSPR